MKLSPIEIVAITFMAAVVVVGTCAKNAIGQNRFPATVHRIKDADTIDATVHMGFGVDYKSPKGFRTDYDAWETTRIRRTLVKGKTEQEAEAFWRRELAMGLKAKEAARMLLSRGELFVEELKTASGKPRVGVYGRPIVRLWVRVDGEFIELGEALKAGGHTRESLPVSQAVSESEHGTPAEQVRQLIAESRPTDAEAYARRIHKEVYEEMHLRLDRGEYVHPALEASAAYKEALKAYAKGAR